MRAPPTSAGTRVVVLGNGRCVRLGDYARAWRAVRAAPASATFKHGLRGWWSVTREELIREFLDGLMDRINRHDRRYGIGRKWDSDWQRETRHAATFLNMPQVIIDWLPPWLRGRFGHRLRAIG
jgi:hypothetical protein